MDRFKPHSCAGCALAEVGRGFLSSEGTGANGCLIVGEAAGSHEAKAGLPFRPSAPAGGLLQRLFNMSGLKREDFTIFNVVNCQPPENELTGAEYEAGAIAHCRQYLDAVVERVKPRMILALGKTAMAALTGCDSKDILSLRGYVLESIYGIPLIGSFHPSFLVRGAQHLTGVVAHDIRRCVSYSKNGVPPPLETHYELTPSIDSVNNYLDRIRSDHNLPVAYDIETAGILGEKEPEALSEKRIIQIQFSSEAGHAIVLPWDGEYRSLAGEILATTNLKMGWYDRGFDRKVLRAQGVTINGECHDLMDAWAHLQPNFTSAKDDTHGDKGVPSKLLGLQSCVSFYFPNEGPWKKPVTLETIKYYGARDADLTFRVGMKLFWSLKELGLW